MYSYKQNWTGFFSATTDSTNYLVSHFTSDAAKTKQTGRLLVPISSELELKTTSWLAQYLSNLLLKELIESASIT